MKSKKKKVSPADQIKEQFLIELNKLLPAHYGLQLMISTLVDKFYDPKIYNAPEIKAARLELAQLVHKHYSSDEDKPTMEELMKRASEIVKMA